MANKINELLLLLADSQFHSGHILGETLGVSRAAVNQYVTKLNDLGVDIFSVHGKGYKLAQAIELLDIVAITAVAGTTTEQLDVLSVVESSNDELRQRLTHANLPAGYAVIAEAQTAGRGRRGKKWFSPFGSNLYISIYWPLPDGVNSSMGLSLVVGVALADALKANGIQNVGVKWPNDVYIDDKKIAGILVELASCTDGSANSIIGVGVNLRMPETSNDSIDQQWTDISQHLHTDWSRNQLAGQIYRKVIDALTQISQHGLAPTKAKWSDYDIYLNRSVRLIMGERNVTGVCKGIDENGAIVLEQNGSFVRYFGGEISLRATDVIN